jgi:hypothetical protein
MDSAASIRGDISQMNMLLRTKSDSGKKLSDEVRNVCQIAVNTCVQSWRA